MEYIAIQKYIGSSPRKLRLVARMARKMEPHQALEMLSFTNKAAAPLLAKAIKTAVANAKAAPVVQIKAIEINEGPRLKRMLVGTAGRGRGRPFKRRLSHIKVVLTDEVSNAGKISKVSKVKESKSQVVNESEVKVAAVEEKTDAKKKGEKKTGSK